MSKVVSLPLFYETKVTLVNPDFNFTNYTVLTADNHKLVRIIATQPLINQLPGSCGGQAQFEI